MSTSESLTNGFYLLDRNPETSLQLNLYKEIIELNIAAHFFLNMEQF